MRAIIKSSLWAAILLALTAGGAAAAPQILGVVASVEPTPLYCQDGTCAADLTTFCLQRSRQVPMSGTLYRVHGSGRVALVAVAADGTRFPLPAEKAEIQVPRGISAMRISITEAQLKAAGGVSVAVIVGENVALVPLPVAGDPEPLTPEEIAYVTGPLRAAAARLFDTDVEVSRALRLTSKLINAHPLYGRMPAAANRELWSKAIGEGAADADDPAYARAAQTYERCLGADSKFYSSLRRCLEARHDRMQMELNHDYWNSVGSGI
ncbi:MAG: hypothetical protein EXQ86_09280 [Rhodospirillales bacterium]|nr:hypothetical protein [Rhodospirillales bacterium]